MEEQDLQKLLEKYTSGNASAREIELLDEWYESVQGDDTSLSDPFVKEVLSEMYAGLRSHIYQTPSSPLNDNTGKIRSIFPYLRWAAAVIFVCSAITFFYLSRLPGNQVAKTHIQSPLINDVAPGGNQAVLTLGNGSKVVLDHKSNGQLAWQGGTLVSKKGNGLLTYAVSGSAPVNQVSYNTVVTPRGGQYQIVLPDGSKVWLNAASSLKFPTAFSGNTRYVELTGEAYFEIAKNKSMPFIVKSDDQSIEVLGTHFNINDYREEPEVKTTLLEGRVKASSGKGTVFLNPGQQAVVSKADNSGNIKVLKDVDMEEIIAWKNGNFQFNNADIETVMRQISRWYNVDIE
ncbi:MAG TPA: FecR domain-containing protein, partial [Pedobacter sp.]